MKVNLYPLNQWHLQCVKFSKSKFFPTETQPFIGVFGTPTAT